MSLAATASKPSRWYSAAARLCRYTCRPTASPWAAACACTALQQRGAEATAAIAWPQRNVENVQLALGLREIQPAHDLRVLGQDQSAHAGKAAPVVAALGIELLVDQGLLGGFVQRQRGEVVAALLSEQNAQRRQVRRLFLAQRQAPVLPGGRPDGQRRSVIRAQDIRLRSRCKNALRGRAGSFHAVPSFGWTVVRPTRPSATW